MTDRDLIGLFERTSERTHVGPAPVEQIFVGARRIRRRRWLVTAAGSVAVVTAISGTAVLAMQGTPASVVPKPVGSASSPVITPSSVPSDTPTGKAARTNLQGTWTVDGLVGPDGQSVLPAAARNTMRLTFADGTFTGSTGCNDISGTYIQGPARVGDGARDLRFPRADLGSTLVGCPGEPPLVSRLLDVRHVTASDGRVYLHAENWMIVVSLLPDRADAGSASPGR